MSIDTLALTEIAQTVWRHLLGLDLGPAENAMLETPAMTGSVTIVGASPAVIAVSASVPSVRRFAAGIFELPPNELGLDELRDAIGELANTCGGNAKALVPGSSTLSLPSVSFGADPADEFDGATIHARVVLRCEADVVVITALWLP